MSRTGLLILLGILTIVVPFSGLPISLRTLISVLCGAFILSIGITLRAREAEEASRAVENQAE